MSKDFKKFAQQSTKKPLFFSIKNWLDNAVSKPGSPSSKTFKSHISKKQSNFAQSKVTLTKNTTKKDNEFEEKKPLIYQILGILLIFVALPIKLFAFIFKPFGTLFQKRDLLIKTISCVIFLTLFFQFFNIQVLNREANSLASSRNLNLTFSQRGQIFVQDIASKKTNRPLTASIYTSKITFNPATLSNMIKNGTTTAEKSTQALSVALNLPYNSVFTIIERELKREPARQYAVLYDNLNANQARIFKSILIKGVFTTEELGKQNFINWLNVEDNEVRTYPESTFLSPSIGYLREQPAPTSGVDVMPGCRSMIEENKERGTDFIQYKLPVSGLEEKFCSELSGLNGRELSNAEITSGDQSLKAVDGGDIYLTIDYNVQRRAEEILDKMMKDNANEKGAPTNGSIIVVEINNPTDSRKDGQVLAMASYPRYDPNKYSEEFNKNPAAFRNASTSIDFEIGSVMKPMTVAMALDQYYNAIEENAQLTVKKTCPKGDRPLDLAAQQPNLYDLRLCVSPTWTFSDYPKGTKQFESTDGTVIKVSNFLKSPYGNNLTLSNVLRDSINTGISDIMDTQSRDAVKEYYINKFKFGQPTLANSSSDANGNIRPFNDGIGLRISNTFFGFGQGFTASPMQTVRAYMPLLNQGKMIEPYVVDRIEYPNGIKDDGTATNSKLYRAKAEQVIRPESANLVKSYMIDTSVQGFKGNGRSIDLNGYTNGSKTGTAQIDESVEVRDANGNLVLNEKGQPRFERRDYDWNSSRGLTNHVWAGFAPANKPRVMVFLKMSKPLPGNTVISSLSTLKQPYLDILQYSLEYLAVPKDK